jgi:predicted Zn-dependent protease
MTRRGSARPALAAALAVVLLARVAQAAGDQGKEVDQQVQAQFGFYDDPSLQSYVDRIGSRLTAVSELPAGPWRFRILDSPVVNAFAVPDGYIYVTRGILAHMNSEAELAGVLGHEIGHITGRHSAARQKRSTWAGLGLLLGNVLAPKYSRYFSGIAEDTLGLLLLKYSRGQELDADERGIRYAAAASYDPSGIGGFFETLQRLEHQTDRKKVPGWASTHPQVDDRIERSRDRVAEALSQHTGATLTVGRPELQHAIDGIVFGENPREGFLRGQDFLHPDLRWAITIPRGWRLQNGRSAVTSSSQRGDALIQLTMAAAEAGASPDSAASGLLRRSEAQVLEFKRDRINGLDAALARFRVRSGSSGYDVIGAWIQHEGRIYELLGITGLGRLSSHFSTLLASLQSFRPMNDPEVLAVQPARLRLFRVSEPSELSRVVEHHAEVSVQPATIALINRIELHQMLEPGSDIKLVVGGPGLPRS